MKNNLEPQTWQSAGFPPTKLDDPNAMPMDLKPPQHVFANHEGGSAPLSPLSQTIAESWKANQ